MTKKKRYTYIDISNNDTIGSFFCNGTHLSNQKVVELLNENEELKQAYTQLMHRHSLLHDVCVDAECDRDSYHKDVVSLEKENEQLNEDVLRRKENENILIKTANDLNELIDKLEKENEQLKQFKEDVFTKIDMHLRMLPTFRDNEFNEEYGDPSLYTGAIGILKTLKKELKE